MVLNRIAAMTWLCSWYNIAALDQRFNVESLIKGVKSQDLDGHAKSANLEIISLPTTHDRALVALIRESVESYMGASLALSAYSPKCGLENAKFLWTMRNRQQSVFTKTATTSKFSAKRMGQWRTGYRP